MKVALGTFEVTEEERRAIKLAIGFKSGKASRREVRDFIIAAAHDAVDHAAMPHPEELIRRAEEEQS